MAATGIPYSRATLGLCLRGSRTTRAHLLAEPVQPVVCPGERDTLDGKGRPLVERSFEQVTDEGRVGHQVVRVHLWWHRLSRC